MKTPSTWLVVAGARPNFVKIAPLMKAIRRYNDHDALSGPAVRPVLVHTGQHYDRNLSSVFFEELDIPRPDVNLGVGSGGHGQQTGMVMIALEKFISAERPDLVIVVGDVNSTLAAALVSVKLAIPVAHIEAGLRSFDRTMPEEINRVLTDHVSDYLFTPCEDADRNLLREGIARERIFPVGNILADSVAMILPKTSQSAAAPFVSGIARRCGTEGRYALLTLHRPSNVDRKEVLEGLITTISDLSARVPVIFPVHPRTVKQIRTFGLEEHLAWLDEEPLAARSKTGGRIFAVPAMGYLDFIAVLRGADLVFTDSGGVQEESALLGVPCITLRDRTEWTVTVDCGSNILAGQDAESIRTAFSSALSRPHRQDPRRPALWDGSAAERIVGALKDAAR